MHTYRGDRQQNRPPERAAAAQQGCALHGGAGLEPQLHGVVRQRKHQRSRELQGAAEPGQPAQLARPGAVPETGACGEQPTAFSEQDQQLQRLIVMQMLPPVRRNSEQTRVPVRLSAAAA